MLGPGSHSRWLEARGRIARFSAYLAHRNRHIALAIWLIVVVPALGSLAVHHYDPANWLHWAHLVFFTSTAAALAIAWIGEQTKRSLR